MKEDKYVTYEEWRISRENILEKIKEGDDENLRYINELKEKIAEGNVYQRQSFEVQKDTNKQMKQLNDTNNKQWDAIKEIKFVVKNHEDDIGRLEGTISEKQKNSVQITVALIGTAGTIIVGAFGLAQYFLRRYLCTVFYYAKRKVDKWQFYLQAANQPLNKLRLGRSGWLK